MGIKIRPVEDPVFSGAPRAGSVIRRVVWRMKPEHGDATALFVFNLVYKDFGTDYLYFVIVL